MEPSYRAIATRVARLTAVLLMTVLAGCRRDHAKNGVSERVPDRIRIGATLSFGSAQGKTARFYQEGYELAVEQLNRRGGINLAGRGVPVELKVLDDADDAQTGSRALTQLIEQDHVDFLLGSSSDRVVPAQAAIAEGKHIPYVAAAGATRELFEQPHRYLFGVQASMDQLAYTVMRWVDEQQKGGQLPALLKVAAIADSTPRGAEFRAGVVDFVGKTPSRRASYQLVLEDSFRPGQTDFRPLLSRLEAAHADVALVDGSFADFLSLHRQYLAAGLCHKVLSYGAHGAELDAFEAFGFEGLSYVLSGVWWSSRLARGGLNAEFAAAFNESFHRDPEWYGALSYEAARALFAAIERAGSVDRELVTTSLASLRMDSILPGSRLAFAGNQQARYPFVVQQNMPDGKSAIVYPNDEADAPGVPVNPRCGTRASKPLTTHTER